MSWSSLILNFSTTSEEIIASDFLKSLNHFYSRLVPFVQEKKTFSSFADLYTPWTSRNFQKFVSISCCRTNSPMNSKAHYHNSSNIKKLLDRSRLRQKPARRKNHLIESFFSDPMMCAHVVYPILQAEVSKQTVYRNHFLFRRSKLIDVTLTYDVFFDGTYLLS